ncbi:MAG: VWA domain-containing protein, partial [Salinisphaeraceae bacterium]|nr:VWA domain-containing protein [Salinisphaeraceae bacterium]
HWNEEAGAVWMQRVLNTFDKVVWLNPVPPSDWSWTHSIRMVEELMEHKMYPMTLGGLEEAMTFLAK